MDTKVNEIQLGMVKKKNPDKNSEWHVSATICIKRRTFICIGFCLRALAGVAQWIESRPTNQRVAG